MDGPDGGRTSASGQGSEPPLRIGFCHYTSDVGGGSDRSLYDLVVHLDRARFTPFLILKVGDPLAEGYRAEGLEVAEIPFASPRRTRDWRKHVAFFGRFWPDTIRAARWLRRWKVDLVHVNTINNLQGAFAARLARKPLVWHVRELVPDSRSGALLRALVPRLANRIVANSAAVASSLHGCGARLHTVYNGIDLSAYPARDTVAETSAGGRRIVCVGRLEPWKGQHVLVEALPEVFARHPDCEAWIVGGAAVNKPDYRPALEQRCQALGIGARVTFTGPRDDVPAILQSAVVLVLPSVSPEPFGRTVVEAMAAACPVVATAAGGPLEILEDGVHGRLVPPDDPVALADALSALLSDPEGARAMGQAGRERALEHFALGRVVEEMSTVFVRATERRRD